MSWWKKVVDFFAGTTPDAPDVPQGTPLETAVWRAMRAHVDAGTSFTAAAVAETATRGMSPRPTVDAIKVANDLFHRGLLEPHGYTRTMAATASGPAWVYHHTSSPPQGGVPTTAKPLGPRLVGGATPTPAAAPRATAAATPGRSAPAAATTKAPAPKDPYDVGALLSLTKDELRARALKIIPWKTAWIGRTDVIPPDSDERTALIDRGLELRGLLTRAQISEIHRVGDLWLKHKDSARLAETLARKNVEEAIAQQRIAKQLEKEKRKEAARAKEEARALGVARRKREDIVHLGRGVSFGLADRRSHVERLKELGLPMLSTPADVAQALGITIPQLRFLCFHSDAARRSHYVRFEVPKRSGGTRLLAAPMPHLARAQEWVLDNVLGKLPVEPPAHGFVKGRSTVTNARPHAGRAIVVNQDLVDFFPTITFGRVRGVFVRAGYSPAVATIFALLTTESPRQEATYAGTKYFVALGPRALPQGACTSPALSNQIARKLDRRLNGLANKHGWRYTRYADDLSFSALEDRVDDVPRLLARLRHVVGEEGFTLHIAKGRVQRAARRQTVTGIVVNEAHKLAVPREEVRKLRAILHNAKKTGLAAQNRDGRPNFEAWLRGKIAYVTMVDRARGEQLLRTLDALPR